MIEDEKHQLDKLEVSDILSYLGARSSSMEEHIRRQYKQLTKAKEFLRMVIDSYNHEERFSFEKDLIKAEKFLKEVSE